MDGLILENKRLKAMSCDTRLKILKILYKHNETLSDLAKKMNMQKSTIKDHLSILEESKLVKQVSSNNIWKYYELTDDAKKLINPSGVKVLIAFSITTIIAFIFAIKLYLNKYNTAKASEALSNVFQTSSVTLVEQSSHNTYIWILFVIFFAIAITLLVIYIYRKRKVCKLRK